MFLLFTAFEDRVGRREHQTIAVQDFGARRRYNYVQALISSDSCHPSQNAETTAKVLVTKPVAWGPTWRLGRLCSGLVTVKARRNGVRLVFHGRYRIPQLPHTHHSSLTLSFASLQITSQGPSDSPIAQDVSGYTQHSHSVLQIKLAPLILLTAFLPVHPVAQLDPTL